MEEKELIEEFHRLWYSKGQFQMKLGEGEDQVTVQLEAHYCGQYRVQKNPLDLWIYQEILWDTKPDLIVEMGTAAGGTTLFLAHQLDLIDNGSIISVDIDNRLGILPPHPRITYVVGNAIDRRIKDEITKRASIDEELYKLRPLPEKKKVMVILDDDHCCRHVYQELLLYNELVTPGQYLIVEDTNVDHPLQFGPGPAAAVQAFMSNDKHKAEFEVDLKREKFLMTWNPGGYLRRR